jgi:hypothetical protein
MAAHVFMVVFDVAEGERLLLHVSFEIGVFAVGCPEVALPQN